MSATGHFDQIISSFASLCNEVFGYEDESRPRPGIETCEAICTRISCQEAKTLLRNLSDRASHVEYQGSEVCRTNKVTVGDVDVEVKNKSLPPDGRSYCFYSWFRYILGYIHNVQVVY